MGKRAVQVSGVLWQQICTVGWKWEGIECVEGLPEEATFHSAFYIPSTRLGIHVLRLIFEHPDWPELVPGAEIPTISVVHEQTYDDPGL